MSLSQFVKKYIGSRVISQTCFRYFRSLRLWPGCANGSLEQSYKVRQESSTTLSEQCPRGVFLPFQIRSQLTWSQWEHILQPAQLCSSSRLNLQGASPSRDAPSCLQVSHTATAKRHNYKTDFKTLCAHDPYLQRGIPGFARCQD